MLAGRSVAGLASLAVPAPLFLPFHYEMGTLFEGVRDVFVASLADLGPDVSRRLICVFRGLALLRFGRFRLRGSLLGRSRYGEPQRGGKDRDQGRRAAALNGANHRISRLAVLLLSVDFIHRELGAAAVAHFAAFAVFSVGIDGGMRNRRGAAVAARASRGGRTHGFHRSLRI